MRYLPVFLSFLLLPFTASAAEYSIQVSLTPPVERVNGEKVQPEELDFYEICVGSESGACTYTYSTKETRFVIPAVITPGETYYLRARVSDVYGITSDWSPEIVKTVDTSTSPGPKAPGIEIRIIIITQGGTS